MDHFNRMREAMRESIRRMTIVENSEDEDEEEGSGPGEVLPRERPGEGRPGRGGPGRDLTREGPGRGRSGGRLRVGRGMGPGGVGASRGRGRGPGGVGAVQDSGSRDCMFISRYFSGGRGVSHAPRPFGDPPD